MSLRSKWGISGVSRLLSGSCVGVCVVTVLLAGCGCGEKEKPTSKQEVKEALAVSAVAVDIQLRPDLSNVENLHEFVFTEEQKKFVAENHLLIYDGGLRNPVSAYVKTPVPFVTSDIVLHIYHVLLADTIEKVEEALLRPSLQSFLLAATTDAKKEFNRTSGRARGGAKKLLVLLAVGAELLGVGVDVPEDVKEEVQSLKDSAESCQDLVFDERKIDASLFKARAAYEPLPEGYKPTGTGVKAEQRRAQYFRAVTWLGQAGLRLDDIESLHGIALLAKIVCENEQCRKALAEYEDMVGFLAGPPDGVIAQILCEVAGKTLGKHYKIDASTTESLEKFKKALGERSWEKILDRLEAPGVTAENATKIFRVVLGRYNLTGDLFQRILEDTKQLPSGLDYVHHVLGSVVAGRLSGTANSVRSQALAEKVSKRSEKEWFGTLGEGIEYSLKSIVAPTAEGYPHFMRTEAWSKKSINGALGGWVLLSHDLYVYQKHASFYMDGGGGWLGFNGYVEPNPEFFGRLAHTVRLLSNRLSGSGLFDKLRHEVGEETYKVITSEKHHRLTGSEYATDYHYRRFEELLLAFQEMAKKELENKPFTEEEHTRLKTIGETFRFLTFDVGDAPDDEDKSLVCDVATEYLQGKCLEVAIGQPLVMVVVVPRNDKLYISKGSIFSYYELVRPIGDRMTDSQWRGSKREPGDSFLGKQGMLLGALSEIDDPKKLREYLKDENPNVRASAVKRLVKLGAVETFPEIIKLLSDESVIPDPRPRQQRTVGNEISGVLWEMRKQIGSKLDDMLMDFLFSVGPDAPIETQRRAVWIVVTQLADDKKGSPRIREYMAARKSNADRFIREEVARYKTKYPDNQ